MPHPCSHLSLKLLIHVRVQAQLGRSNRVQQRHINRAAKLQALHFPTVQFSFRQCLGLGCFICNCLDGNPPHLVLSLLHRGSLVVKNLRGSAGI